MAAHTNTLRTDGILAIVRDPVLPFSPAIFSKAISNIKGKIVTLTLPAGQQGSKPAELSFETRINDIVKKWKDPRDFNDSDSARDEEKIVSIYVLFREYEQLAHADVKLLEQKVIAAIEKTLPVPKKLEKESVIPPRQIEQLFRLERHVKEKTALKNIVLCIGESGTGKSTAANYACTCEIREVDATLFGKPSGSPNVIVARNSQAVIGHTMSSETTVPNVLIPAAAYNFVYVDCPGFGDSRGDLIELCNALSIRDAIEGSRYIKASLLFLPYSQLIDARIINSIKAFTYFQLLFKTFDKKYLDNFKFVITQCPPGDHQATIPYLIRRRLVYIIEQPTTDPLLKEFCQQMFDLQAYMKFMICNPLLGDKGESFNKEVYKCIEIPIAGNATPPSFGYPISSESLRTILKAQNAIVPMVQTELLEYHELVHQFWKKSTDQAKTVPAIEEVLNHLNGLYRLSLEERSLEAITRENYLGKDSESHQGLRQCLDYWNRMQSLQPQNQRKDINPHLQGSWELFSSKIKDVQSLAKQKRERLIVNAVQATLGKFLESYLVQHQLKKYRDELGDLANAEKLLQKIREFGNLAKPPIPYLEELGAILRGSQPTFQTLCEFIRSHIAFPIEITGRGTSSLSISSRINKIALSQVFEDLGEAELGAEGAFKEITLKHQTEQGNKNLYFDKSLSGKTFKGKYIIILADHVVVRKRSIINLQFAEFRGGYIQINSSLKGTVESAGDDLVLSPSDTVSSSMIARSW